ncbi:molybdopterin converting factor subunit 1 [Methyloradius palustris]|uniref:Molybdopterin synthase sulfur carrier subunit n=1 Tax=Methyloradius palustris TaxID=2778876 RepID=A0A8D5GEM1_9PROT|nr:molybdopterin converting factor subunit 1 [Methyloradius palustris]BCM25299.1 molybdopterin synthase sulfur carrier subunit [Methyloradius palustris]
MIKVLYFASLREQLGVSTEQIILAEPEISVADLVVKLAARGADWQHLAANKNVRVAVNQTLVTNDAIIKAGDEVAFFPPVTGG